MLPQFVTKCHEMLPITFSSSDPPATPRNANFASSVGSCLNKKSLGVFVPCIVRERRARLQYVGILRVECSLWDVTEKQEYVQLVLVQVGTSTVGEYRTSTL